MRAAGARMPGIPDGYVESRLRTYMLNGTDPEELEPAAIDRLAAFLVGLTGFECGMKR